VLPPNRREQRIQRYPADREVAPIEDGLQRRDPAAIDAALVYLEADPPGFRTGYAKQRLLHRLRGQTLSRAQRDRVGALALRATTQGFRGAGRQYGKLVRKFATNSLRRTLRERVHTDDPEVAWRAFWLLMHVRHPQLSPAEIAVARDLLRREAAHEQRRYFRDTNEFARRLWDRSWQTELERLARDEHDLGARRLLDAARQRERVREWKATKRRKSATHSEEASSGDEV
jgi:hypothetical protein